MPTDTPAASGAPTARAKAHLIRAAVHAVELRWRLDPAALRARATRDELLLPLLACAARAPEPGAEAHMRGVGRLAAAVAAVAGWESARAEELCVHGALHDLGKALLPARVLAKPGSLTPDERRCVERHAEIGFRLLKPAAAPILRTAARVAHEHHEWWNGAGYPRRLAGFAIHPAARTVALADVYDALTTDRPYRAALAPDAALRVMRGGRGTQFDPDLYDAFARAWPF